MAGGAGTADKVVLSKEQLETEARDRFNWIDRRLQDITEDQKRLEVEALELRSESSRLNECFSLTPPPAAPVGGLRELRR